MGRLDGKIAIITGGARGQGAAEGQLFASEGASVVLTDVLDDAGEHTAAQIGEAASYRHHDVSQQDEWSALVDAVLAEHGRVDVLVNNAGIVIMKPIEELTLDDYMRVISVNQVGVFLGMRAVTPAMRAARRGSIVNTSSVSGLRGHEGQIAYSASKWAIRGMTRSAARELAPDGVRVNSIHPGVIDTPMVAAAGHDEASRDALRARIPVGEFGAPEAIARMALYLASDESAYSTGAEFVVDGGLTA